MSRARWREYRQLLRVAIGQEYDVLGVERWLAEPDRTSDRPLLLLRHDVDQHPASAVRMAAIEGELGLTSTWYFRWRTAQPRVIGTIRDAGHAVGLHYETLTRIVLERGLRPDQTVELIDEARQTLMRELTAFGECFGPVRSACPHGDTRVPGVHNGVLLRGEDLTKYGLEWDVNDAVGRRGVDLWLTDRSRAEGRWQDGADAVDTIIDRRSPLLLIVHPNNWVSGPALWWDRLVPGRARTGSDQPALLRGGGPVGTGERLSPAAP
jgi:hypothetical protein